MQAVTVKHRHVKMNVKLHSILNIPAALNYLIRNITKCHFRYHCLLLEEGTTIGRGTSPSEVLSVATRASPSDP
jgi:hypothetical protein